MRVRLISPRGLYSCQSSDEAVQRGEQTDRIYDRNDYDPDGELPADTRPVSAYLTYVAGPTPDIPEQGSRFPSG